MVGFLGGSASTLPSPIEQAVETVTVFGTSGFIAAGGPMNLVLGAGLTVLTWLLTGIVVSRRMTARLLPDASNGR